MRSPISPESIHDAPLRQSAFLVFFLENIMNGDVFENCVAIAAIACVAIFASKLNLDPALSSAAIAAIAGLAGHGVSGTVARFTRKEDTQ